MQDLRKRSVNVLHVTIVFTAGRTTAPGNVFFLFQMPPCGFLSFCYKSNGHSQLMHMRIRYHFLADLHITRYAVHTVKDYSETGQTGFQ